MIAPLAVTLGDPAGIGPEIVGKAWDARHDATLPCFFAVGNETALRRVWSGPIATIGSPAEAQTMYEGYSRWEGAEVMQQGIIAMGHDGITHIGGGRVQADGVTLRGELAVNGKGGF